MAVTIHVNGMSNSLSHKGGMGITKSTLPDVCKTPSPGRPVPIPYPVIVSMTNSLKKGSKKVKVDGGNSAAIKGSEFSRCNGDEPGTAGGVKSSTNMKEATWILYSFDVKIEGKNACRLSDKMMMNHGNTACLGGHVIKPVPLSVLEFDSVEFPEKTANIKKAMGKKKKMKLTRHTSKSAIRKNRRAALKGHSKGPAGTSLDEFPFASCTAGGAEASVAAIDVDEQNKQGGKMSSFYQNNNIGDGDSYWVKIT